MYHINIFIGFQTCLIFSKILLTLRTKKLYYRFIFSYIDFFDFSHLLFRILKFCDFDLCLKKFQMKEITGTKFLQHFYRFKKCLNITFGFQDLQFYFTRLHFIIIYFYYYYFFRIGRKNIFTISVWLQGIAGCGMAFAQDYWSFTFLRVLVGASTSGQYLAAYVIGKL